MVHVVLDSFRMRSMEIWDSVSTHRRVPTCNDASRAFLDARICGIRECCEMHLLYSKISEARSSIAITAIHLTALALAAEVLLNGVNYCETKYL